MAAAAVEAALAALWGTTEPERRRQADAWLQSFQASVDAWHVAAQLIAHSSSEDVRLFACTVLCNKLRGGTGGDLEPAKAKELRDVLLGQLRHGIPPRLEAQLCRAVASLVGCCSGDGPHPTITFLGDEAVCTLQAHVLLQILAIIPAVGGWISDGEVNAVINIQCDVLTYAFCEGSPFPRQLPSGCAPAVVDNNFRVAALKCAVAWTSLPSTDELSLSMLAELPCFPALVNAVRGSSELQLQRHAVELCTAALEQEALSPSERGTYLPFVGADMTRQFIGALATSLEPLANNPGTDDDTEESESERTSTLSALVGLGASLLSKGSAILAEGGSSPSEALALLRLLVISSGHPTQQICEVGSNSSTWAVLLRVADGWETGLRAQLLSSLGSTIVTRLQYPPDSRLALWDEEEMTSYDGWRENFLCELVCEVCRHQQDLFLTAVLSTLEGEVSQDWKQLEATLCAARFAADVTIAHLSTDAALHSMASRLLSHVLTPFATVSETGSSLLEAARFRIFAGFSSFIADSFADDSLRDTIGAAVSALQRPGSDLSRIAAAFAMVHLLRDASSRLAASPALLRAIVESILLPISIPDHLRNRLLEETSRCIATMNTVPEQQQLLQVLFSPLVGGLEQLVATAEANAASGELPDEQLSLRLCEKIDLCACAIRPLRPIGPAALAAMLSHVWPVWLRVLALVQAAALELFGADFAPYVSATANALVTAFSRSEAGECMSMAMALVETFCDLPDCESALVALLDQFGSIAFSLLQPAPLDRLELAGPLFDLAYRYASLLPRGVAQASSLPLLIELAGHLIMCSFDAEPLSRVFDFLSALARAVRSTAHPAARSRLLAAVGESRGEALVHVLIGGLAESLPTSIVPRVADVLAPLLYAESWRTSFSTWAQQALTALPSSGGVPDERAKASLLQALNAIPDPCGSGATNLDATEALRGTLIKFAQLCRRMVNEDDFELACYDWKENE